MDRNERSRERPISNDDQSTYRTRASRQDNNFEHRSLEFSREREMFDNSHYKERRDHHNTIDVDFRRFDQDMRQNTSDTHDEPPREDISNFMSFDFDSRIQDSDLRALVQQAADKFDHMNPPKRSQRGASLGSLDSYRQGDSRQFRDVNFNDNRDLRVVVEGGHRSFDPHSTLDRSLAARLGEHPSSTMVEDIDSPEYEEISEDGDPLMVSLLYIQTKVLSPCCKLNCLC